MKEDDDELCNFDRKMFYRTSAYLYFYKKMTRIFLITFQYMIWLCKKEEWYIFSRFSYILIQMSY